LSSRFAILFSLVALIVIGALRTHPGDAQAIEAYHDRVKRIIQAIPIDIDGWVGQQVPLPQSAMSLLRPNAIIARQYVNAEKGLSATLLIIQCRDTRDMAGHYPPRCYPANGWLESTTKPEQTIREGTADLRVYGFHRVTGRVERDITVYSLFALPTGELTTSMDDVRRLSSDYESRKYGAAQIQIVIDGDVDPEDHRVILDEMYKIAQPTIKEVLDLGDQQDGHSKGDAS